MCRFILGAEVPGASTGGQALHERLACLLCSRVLGCLAAVISQARLLTPKEQVPHLQSCCDHSCVGLWTALGPSFQCSHVLSPCTKALEAI